MHGARLCDDSREGLRTGFMTRIRNGAIKAGVQDQGLGKDDGDGRLWPDRATLVARCFSSRTQMLSLLYPSVDTIVIHALPAGIRNSIRVPLPSVGSVIRSSPPRRVMIS